MNETLYSQYCNRIKDLENLGVLNDAEARELTNLRKAVEQYEEKRSN